MNNRPNGRKQNITGTAKKTEKKGSGLGIGPVGKSDAYQGRTGSSSSSSGMSRATTRAIGGGSTVIIIIAVILFAVFGKNLFGNGTTVPTNPGTNQTPAIQQGSDTTSTPGGSILQGLSGLFTGYTGATGTSSASSSNGWSSEASSNTNTLNSTVASSARAKYTKINGNGNDHVTIMVYMCGTDLESKSGMATSDLTEMASATLSGDVDIIVYTGGCKKWQNNIVSNTYNQIYKIEKGGLRTLVSNDGNASMTNPTTLTNFINYCTKNYPANRNILIFWDHGGGSISGYGYDEKNSSTGSMSLAGINTALKNAGTKFDIIGFDACLMATLENGLMLENYADYLIASEETEPGVGWYYTDWVTALSKNPSLSSLEIGKNIVDDFVSTCARQCRGQKTTLSVVDLAELGATVPAKFSDFATDTSGMINNGEYKAVADARASAREFAPESRIDQVDLVHLANNIGTTESKALAKALLNCVKYNKTSTNMTNAYGIAIYFPYSNKNTVNNAVRTYEALGMDSDYTQCLRSFASLGLAGSSASSSSPLDSLLGSFSGSSALSSSGVSDLIGSLLGDSSFSSFFGRGLSTDNMVSYITDNQLDSSKLTWTKEGSNYVLKMSEEQWSLVHDLTLNVFLDDGEGFIDLGLDNVYQFTDSGDLIGSYNGAWLTIDGQTIPYYFMDQTSDGDVWAITGRVPILLNGDHAELIIVFDNENENGYIAGARYIYEDGETDTVAKGINELTVGDEIEFVCDYYTYSGEYVDSYILGDGIVYTGNHEISDMYVDGGECVATYVFTDMYGAEHWTEEIPD